MFKDAFAENKGLRSALSAVCCGFLFSRGIAGGARCAGWDMPALMGDRDGSLWGAVLFCLACVTSCIVRRDCGVRSAALLNCLTAAVYTLHIMMSPSAGGVIISLVDGAAVMSAIVLAGERKPGAVQIAVLALTLIPARVCPLPPLEPMLVLRLGALTGALSSAGLCGAAIAWLCERDTDRSGPGIAVGAALGIL